MKADSVGVVKTRTFTFGGDGDGLRLEYGGQLGPVTLAYETYGELNDEKTNAILIFHALSGDAHVAGYHSRREEKPGWWDSAVGPGRMFDTDRHFVICANVIGGCRGSTGPTSLDPRTGKPFGIGFPVITIKDMVDAQVRLLDHLGVERVLAAVGGSMGGFQVLQFAVSYPRRCNLAIPIATAGRQSAQNIAFNEIGRQAIFADPRWNGGDYSGRSQPVDGLSIARMVGHVTYLSDETLRKKFGRKTKNGLSANGHSMLQPHFEIESYLRHKGDSFTKRFDANSYLYITKAIDLFDLSPGCESLHPAFRDCRSRFLVLSFSSDWLYPPYQSEELAEAIRGNGLSVEYHTIESSYGHDAFLLETDKLEDMVSRFIVEDGRKKYYEVDHSYPIS